MLGFASLWALFIATKPETPPAPGHEPKPVERELSDLLKIDGFLITKGDSNRYSGWVVQSYKDGGQKSRTEVLDGLLHGVSEGYYTNGHIQVREFFTNGVSHGVRTKWRIDGSRASEGTLAGGEFNGVFRRWYENGKMYQRVEMSNGAPNGVSRGWYPSGFLQTQVQMSNGKIISREEWKDGEKRIDPQ